VRSSTWAASTVCSLTDLAWRRVKHPSEVLAVGDEAERRGPEVRPEEPCFAGAEAAGEDPWVGLGRRYPQGTRLFGKVTNITDYGAFVEIESGIEGLVHWSNGLVATEHPRLKVICSSATKSK
jgi:small subunit ribosomal protein S1